MPSLASGGPTTLADLELPSVPTRTAIATGPAAASAQSEIQGETSSGSRPGGALEGPTCQRNPTKGQKRKKTKKKFLYGNYDAYYAYRLPPQRQGPGASDVATAAATAAAKAAALDPRLALLDDYAGWISGRRVLDIGCNAGDLTFALAQRFSPAHVLGVDIDQALIRRAQLRLVNSMTSPASEPSIGVESAVSDPHQRQPASVSVPACVAYPANLSFRCEAPPSVLVLHSQQHIIIFWPCLFVSLDRT